jgi:hypothetical protein
VDVERITDSCGYSVPRMAEVAERDLPDRWSRRDDVRARRAGRAASARDSIDGLPALRAAETDPTAEHLPRRPLSAG